MLLQHFIRRVPEWRAGVGPLERPDSPAPPLAQRGQKLNEVGDTIIIEYHCGAVERASFGVNLGACVDQRRELPGDGFPDVVPA